MWEDDEDLAKNGESEEVPGQQNKEALEQQDVSLDIRDYIALAIASLQTFLLPLVVLILLLLGIVIALALLR